MKTYAVYDDREILMGYVHAAYDDAARRAAEEKFPGWAKVVQLRNPDLIRPRRGFIFPKK